MPYTLASGVHVKYVGVPEKYQSINQDLNRYFQQPEFGPQNPPDQLIPQTVQLNGELQMKLRDETMHSIFADAVAYP